MPRVGSNVARLPLPENSAPTEWRCFCVPIPDDVDWVAAFIGSLNRLALQNSWQRDANETAKTVAGKWREVMYMVQSQVSNPCCGDGGSIYIDQRNIINQRTMIRNQNFGITQNFVQQWVDASNDVTLIFNNCPEDWDADSGDSGQEILDRDAALCFAARALIDTILEDLQDQILGLAPDVAALLVSSSFVPFLNIPVYFIGIAAVTIGALAHDVAGRDEYREFLACCMAESMRGQSTNDLTSFQNALPNPVCANRPDLGDALAEEAGDQIENHIRATLQARENYLAFASIMGTAFDVVATQGYDCPCDADWYHDWLNGTNEGSQWWQFHDIVAGKFPTFDDVNHWIESVDHQAPTGSTYVWMSWPVGTPYTLRRMKFYMTQAGQRSASDWFTLADNATPQTIGGTGILNSIQVPDNLQTIDFDFEGGAGAVEVTDTLSLYAYMGISNTVEPDPDRYMRIYRIEIWGSGVDPFD